MLRFTVVSLLAAGLFAQNSPKDRMVVLISLDGFQAFARSGQVRRVNAERRYQLANVESC